MTTTATPRPALSESLEQYLTRHEVCQKLHLHRDTLRRWALETPPRLVPVVFSGRWVRYRLADVQRLLNASRFSRQKKPGPKPKPVNAAASAT